MSFLGDSGGGVIGNIVGSLIGADSSRKAVNAQRDSANQANETQRYIYDTARADNAPALDARNSALTQIQNLLQNPSGITSQPGYQFELDQGTNALNSSNAARGLTGSGAAAKELMRYGQDYAGTKLDQSYNRLSNLAGFGQVGANNNQMAGQNYGNNVSQNQIGLGNAQAGASLYNGRNWGNAANALASYGQNNGWFNSGSSGGQVADPFKNYTGDYNSLAYPG
jgi:hypothetical protein